jgi:hypothetical protein
MISRRRQDEPSNPSKLAKREAKTRDTLQRSLRMAQVREHPLGGGTLLTEPLLVFHGKHRQDLRVFGRDSKELGVARWSPDKAAKLNGYGIYSAGDEVPLVIINWQAPGWLRGSGNYTVSDSEQVEIATLSPRPFRSGLGIMVRGETIGYLAPPSLRSGYVNDYQGREVARIKDMGLARCYVADIEPSLAGPLRAVTVIASIICLDKRARHGGGGG